MQITIYDNNHTILKGRITKINKYSEKAANVVIAVDSGTSAKDGKQRSQFISLKSFKKDEWDNWKIGMFVECHCHLSPNNYKNPENPEETIYSLDVVLDTVIYLESKSVVESREAVKADRN